MSNTTFEDATETITDAVSNVASDVREKLGDLVGEAQKCIKDYPVAALIGAVVVGFAAGRMLRR